MKTLTTLITVVIFILMLTAGAKAQKISGPISFKESLKLAVNNSAILRISLLEEKKLKYRQQEAKGAGLPNINATGAFDDYLNLPTQLIPGEIFGFPGEMIPVQFGTSYNISGSVDANMIIYNQVFIAALRLAKESLEQGRLTTEQVQNNIVLAAGKSYYATQATVKQISNLRDIVSRIEKSEKVAQTQYENGIIKKTDIDRFTVAKLNLLTDLDRLEVIYQNELSFEKYLMGISQDQEIQFPDSVDMNIIPFSKQNLDQHIEMRLLESSRKIAGSGLNINRAEYFPSLTFIGSTSYVNQSNEFHAFGKSTDWFNTSLVGLRLNVPIFDGFQKRSKINQSKVLLEQIGIQEEDTRKRLEIDSRDAEKKLTIAIAAEQRQRLNQELAQNVYNATQEQYQQGVIPLTDLLSVEEALIEARRLHVTALINMKIAELDYMNANGILLNLLEQ